jgi:predicted nucleic acid-binding protein
MIVVSDSTIFRYLVFIGAEEVLASLFGTIHAPPEVLAELQRSRSPELEPVRRWAASPPAWLVVREPSEIDEGLAVKLDPGEVAALSLARELNADRLLIDEKRGRRIAKELGFSIAGTLAVLEEAAVRDLIDIEQAVSKLRASNYRAREDLYESIVENVRRRKST